MTGHTHIRFDALTIDYITNSYLNTCNLSHLLIISYLFCKWGVQSAADFFCFLQVSQSLFM